MKASNWQGLSLGISAVVLATAMGASSPAAADTYRDTSAGAACHAANGALAAKFTFNLNYLTNAGTTDAYVICLLPMDDVTVTPDESIRFNIHGLIPTAGTTVTCVAQNGAYFGSANHIYSSAAKSLTAASANSELSLSWSAAEVHRAELYWILSVNCKLPPGAKLGTIERWETPA